MEPVPEDQEVSKNVTQPNPFFAIAEAVGVYFGRLPASLQKNVLKACDHLFKVPNAISDGKAEELRAVYAARAKITQALGDKLAQSVEVDSALANMAIEIHAKKILRHHRNSIGVLKFAADELNSRYSVRGRIEPTLSLAEEAAMDEISEDWLNSFESEAVNMSSEQMQLLFGKMLAGEIAKPNSYSVRTVKLMGQMDSDVARLFQRFCSMCITIKAGVDIVDSRALSFGHHGTFGLHKFGLTFLDVGVLAEYGLITEPNSSEIPYALAIRNGKLDSFSALNYCGKRYFLEPIPPKTPQNFEQYVERGFSLSRVGRELLSIVDITQNIAYTNALVERFYDAGLHFLEIPNRT